MTHFIKSGNILRVAKQEALDIRSLLPKGNYTVKFDERSDEFYLESIDAFTLPKKLYGDTTSRANRIINTFLNRPSATGVLLSGEKGSGKTLLAKVISLNAQEQDIPTIVVNNPFCGEKFNTFIQSIEQPVIIIFDEFEKVYDNEQQDSMLTLLDGTYQTKKLFILTCNDVYAVNSHMKNRPGRIFYSLDYSGITEEFVREYCMDVLKEKQHIEKIVEIVRVFKTFAFDMLAALVEEMNRYEEDPITAIQMMNIKPAYSASIQYDVLELIIKGEKVDNQDVSRKVINDNPLNTYFELSYKEWYDDEDDSDCSVPTGATRGKHDYNWRDVEFSPNDLLEMNSVSGLLTFQNSDGSKVILRKKQTNDNVDFWKLF